jgi:hypothetical protein
VCSFCDVGNSFLSVFFSLLKIRRDSFPSLKRFCVFLRQSSLPRGSRYAYISDMLLFVPFRRSTGLHSNAWLHNPLSFIRWYVPIMSDVMSCRH